MLYFSRLKKEDLNKYANLTRKELSAEDYYSPKALLDDWEEIDSFVLKNSQNEWIGWCAISSKSNICNPDGKNILSSIIFPKFRGQGYSKYLYKICFDKSLGKNRLTRVNPYNDLFLKVTSKYGFTPHNTNRIWDTYVCDKNHYPEEFRSLPLTELA